MSRLRLPMHGRDHLPGGADPIPWSSAQAMGIYTFDVFGGGPAAAGASTFALEFAFAGGGAGVDLLDLVTRGPDQLIPRTPGMFVFLLRIGFFPATGAFSAGEEVQVSLNTNNEPAPANSWAVESRVWLPLTAAFPWVTCMFARYIHPGVEGPAGGSNYVQSNIDRTATAVGITVNGELVVQRIY